MIAFNWEFIMGVSVGIELLENADFSKEDNLKWVFILHLGIIRLDFTKYDIAE